MIHSIFIMLTSMQRMLEIGPLRRRLLSIDRSIVYLCICGVARSFFAGMAIAERQYDIDLPDGRGGRARIIAVEFVRRVLEFHLLVHQGPV